MVRIAFAVLIGAAIAGTALANVAEPEEFITREVAEQDLFGRAAAQVMNDMFSREELSDMFGRDIEELSEREIDELMSREIEFDEDLLTREIGEFDDTLEAREPFFGRIKEWFKKRFGKKNKDKKNKKKKEEEDKEERREFTEEITDLEARSSIFGKLSLAMGSVWNDKPVPGLAGAAPAKKGAPANKAAPPPAGEAGGDAAEARELEDDLMEREVDLFEEPIERSLDAADDLVEREFDNEDLLERDFEDEDLLGRDFDDEELLERDFDEDLLEREFDDADLLERDFEDADLLERDFEDADLLERDYEGELYEREFDEEVFEREFQEGLDEIFERAFDILAEYDALD